MREYEDVTDLFQFPPSPRPKGPVFCECGLFAKWLRDRSYYNGQFDCYSYTVLCKRCGEMTVDCV